MLTRRDRMHVFAGTVGFAAALGLSASAGAEELAPGTVINAANIDQVKTQTFEGHKVGDLIPERLEWQVRNKNLKIRPVEATNPIPYDPRINQLTEQYKGQASLDPTTNMIENYTTGIPFPEINPEDPQVGAKIVWNYTTMQPHGDQFWCPFAQVLIEGSQGIERVQHWTFARYYMRARVNAPHIQGDGSQYHKSLLFARFPQDIKGLGTFSIRHWDPKLDDIWAYIRTVRRIRRLSGGAWMDPIGGTDQLQDDLETFNAHPSWYKSYKLLGKTHVLAHANSAKNLPIADRGSWYPDASSDQDTFPRIDLSSKPYWNTKDMWEVRPVYVVESTPPEYHPYSRKINWFDAEIWRPYYFAAYDQKGEFWKWSTFANKEYESLDGWRDANGNPAVYMFTAYGVIIDFQRDHGSFFTIEGGGVCQFNPPNLSPEDFNLAVLEETGR